MSLRGIKPSQIEKRLKMLLYGPAGCGKTTSSIQWPRPYLIDTERGAENEQYVKLLNEAGGAYYFTVDPDELIAEAKSLLSEKHDYRTLVIDPLTVIYNDLLDKAAAEVGTDFGRHKGPADRKIKHLLTLLLRLDMNVIITSHAKPKWERAKDSKGKDTVIENGLTFDCYGRLDYLFDLVIEVSRRGKECTGTVVKTRIEAFPLGDRFPFSYAEVARRYGKEVIEKEAAPQELAAPEQVAEIERLIKTLHLTPETTAKWLDKAGAESWIEMPAEAIGKCIEWCRKQISAAA
jgi:hypothetical protein